MGNAFGWRGRRRSGSGRFGRVGIGPAIVRIVVDAVTSVGVEIIGDSVEIAAGKIVGATMVGDEAHGGVKSLTTGKNPAGFHLHESPVARREA